MVGSVYLTTPLTVLNSENIFLVMTEQLFQPILVWYCAFCCTCRYYGSTASAQLLVGASAVAQDLYKQFIHKDVIFVKCELIVHPV